VDGKAGRVEYGIKQCYVVLPIQCNIICVAPAGLWMARREELGHPLGVITPPSPPPTELPIAAGNASAAAPFVLEVGTEELPPEDLIAALEQLRCVCVY